MGTAAPRPWGQKALEPGQQATCTQETPHPAGRGEREDGRLQNLGTKAPGHNLQKVTESAECGAGTLGPLSARQGCPEPCGCGTWSIFLGAALPGRRGKGVQVWVRPARPSSVRLSHLWALPPRATPPPPPRSHPPGDSLSRDSPQAAPLP